MKLYYDVKLGWIHPDISLTMFFPTSEQSYWKVGDFLMMRKKINYVAM